MKRWYNINKGRSKERKKEEKLKVAFVRKRWYNINRRKKKGVKKKEK